MADDNLSAPAEPVATPAPTDFEGSVAGLSKLLGDPDAPDPAQDSEAEQAADETAEPEADASGEDEFPDAEDVEDSEAEADDGSEPEIKGGRFAPDSAKVTLDDGTVTTIGELKRNTLFQRDYTAKTTALAEERKAFTAEREQVVQQAQALSQFREYAAWYAEQHLPKPPGEPPDPNADPHGYQLWTFERDKYASHVNAWQTFQALKQQEEQQRTGETQMQMQARLQGEARKLEQAFPFLRDPEKRQQFWAQTESEAARLYGITSEEVRTVGDHRMVRVLRDAIAYRRLKASAPKAKEDAGKRPVAPTAKRGDPSAMQQRERQARSERLQKTGSIEDATALLKHLIS